MTEFFQTRMGQTFYEHTMPTIARELQRLNEQLERIAVAIEKQNTPTEETADEDTKA